MPDYPCIQYSAPSHLYKCHLLFSLFRRRRILLSTLSGVLPILPTVICYLCILIKVRGMRKELHSYTASGGLISGQLAQRRLKQVYSLIVSWQVGQFSRCISTTQISQESFSEHLCLYRYSGSQKPIHE